MLLEQRRQVEQATDKSVREVCEDIGYLRNIHQPTRAGRTRIQRVLDGPEGIADILGIKKGGETPPVANLVHSALNRLAQKINHVPDLTVDAHRDSQTAREQAEKIERIVRSYDDAARMDLATPQLARWLPGYGFCPIVVTDGYDRDGNPFPFAEIRDPYDSFPSSWGIQRPPDRIAFLRQIDPNRLARIYPEHAADIRRQSTYGGAVLLDSTSQSQGPRGSTIEVAEYIDVNGTWTVLESKQILLDFTPNPVYPMPCFTVAQRFSFNKLIGHSDQSVGLLLANAKLNLLTLIAMEDAVFAEKVLEGELAQGNEWRTGPNAINHVTPGSKVYRLPSGVPPQMFQETDRVERQFRVTSGYSVMDDAQSPNSFVTGRGLDELRSGVDNEVKEYRTVERRAFEDIDTIRLCWDEKAYPNKRKPIYGYTGKARGAEMYRPKADIGGRWRTRRKDGLLSGLDEPSKVIQLLQLAQAEWMDDISAMEQIDGIDDIPKVRKRLASQRSEKLLTDIIGGLAGQGDPRAMEAFLRTMAPSDWKEALEDLFMPDEDEQGQGQPPLGPPDQQAAGPSEDTATLMSRMLSGGGSTAGAQLVQRMG